MARRVNRDTGTSTAYASGPTFNAGWIDNPEDPNGPDNSVGYDGYWFDLAGATESTSTGLYMVRHRVYDPKLGQWQQRDPAGCLGGFPCASGASERSMLSQAEQASAAAAKERIRDLDVQRIRDQMRDRTRNSRP